ncbi:ribosomal protein S5 domain 2-type protein [Cokeromyces recurvatus]|uniref:ribosomal protein S5 domain 2-type protein n=1 Tax=Cokeromyces recurvatus TaxID=90255 RepID=UPI0022212837|nr:ribosomal protein S5 domain 2-type protein [Cokeromyces recurvatus]KAI7898841.1 ribosomal protein S5 domain 2-type protein [Cokeromyces recurvatus]
MVKEIDPSLNEVNFLLEALREGRRVDGREVYDMRSLEITLGTDYGHVEVQLGRTRVAANVSAEVVRPYPDKPTEGQLIFNTEISPMAAPFFEVGSRSEDEVLISRLIEKSLRRSRAIDTEGLCIVAGEKVWQIRVDLLFLDHDGNLVDCASIAAITALLHFRRPDVTVSGEEVTIHPIDQRNPVPLSIHHIPICITFAFFDKGERLVVDPNYLENQAKEGDMTITMNIHREICCLSKAGGIPLEMDQVLRCSQIAIIKVNEIDELIKKVLEEDKEKRQKSSK